MTRPDAGPTHGARAGHRRGALDGGRPGGRLPEHHQSPNDHAPDAGSADGPVRHETGTTIVGLCVRGDGPDGDGATASEDAADSHDAPHSDAVVLATDRRSSLGGRFVANKDVRKVEQVHPTAAMAISGAVGPAQQLLEGLRAEASLYAARRGEPMSMRALSETAGALNRGRHVAPILGGVDAEGAHVFEIDGGGSVVADDYAAGGSGMQVAYGVLEGEYDPEASVAAATETARTAVEAASERDTASGNGVTVATVTAGGVTVESVSDGTTGLEDGGASR